MFPAFFAVSQFSVFELSAIDLSSILELE